MRAILIASGEKLQHGHCKRNFKFKQSGVNVTSNGLMLHNLVTMRTLPHRNDMKYFNHFDDMGTD